MSRNIRQPRTPSKVPKRRDSDSGSSSFDFSDDDGYSAVEDISDSSDDDEEDVNAVEEQNIVTEGKPSKTPRPQEDEEEEDDYDESVPIDADAEESASWAGIVSEVEESDVFQDSHFDAVERHVHFDVPPSDSDSTDTDDDDLGELYPDIFVSQTSLDPAFRREIEQDSESGGSGSYWDYSGQCDQGDSDAEEIVRQFSDDDTPTATPQAKTPAFEQSQELDGYETDGDTTEEDIPEPPIRRRTRRQSVLSEVSDSDAVPSKYQRGQPRVGRFNLDRSDKKPIAVLNPATRKMMIFTPHRRRQLDLSPEQFNFNWAIEDQSSPILSNSANMMLSAMFSSNTFGDFVNPQTMGPTEAFFPFPSEGNEESSAPSLEGEEDEGEKQLDIGDFIAFDDAGSTGDEDDTAWEPSSTPLRPNERDPLSHINSETVGAFRRNQINQQLILSHKATQDSLAFSNPYTQTTYKGLKSDRVDTAGIPLTPVRRQRKENLASPLEKVSAKRKASSDANTGHKRHRSISDINMITI